MKIIIIQHPHKSKAGDTILLNYLGLLKREFANYNIKKLSKDILAGLTVAVVALPLALSFGLANVSDPSAGLITAIVGGILISTLAGGYFQISGPTGVMGIILISVMSEFGMEGIFVVTIMSGLILLLLGIFKLGKLTSLVPVPVIIGFSSSIAVSRTIGQIDAFFGVKSEGLSSFSKIISYLKLGFNPNSDTILIGILTLLIIIFFPKKWENVIPSYLVALVVTILIVFVFKLEIPSVGELPKNLLPEKRASFSNLNISLVKVLIKPALSISMLAMIETLLCGVSASRIANAEFDSSQELVAQGIGYLVMPFFGGIPTTSILLRTNLAIKSGAKTRLTGIFQGLFILLFTLFLSPLIAKIPLSTLAGIMIMTAWRMNEWETIKYMFSKKLTGPILQFILTIIVTLTFNLSVAVLIGILIELVVFLSKSIDLSVEIENIDIKRFDEQCKVKFKNSAIVYITGELFFMNRNILLEKLEEVENKDLIIFSLRGVSIADISVIRLFMNYYEDALKQNKKIVFSSVHPKLMEKFKKSGFIDVVGKDSFYSSTNIALNMLFEK